jgi:uncharacterized protein
MTPETVPIQAARTLLLQGLGLLEPPDTRDRHATPAAVLRQIEALGFVQLDSIHIVERAHHHILWTRLPGYRPAALEALQRSGRIFEHWTHDASLIPSRLFPHWRHRFDRIAWGGWLQQQMGADGKKTARAVLERVRREGPLQARDFEHHGGKSGGWWEWKPAKAALEYWWRRGALAIPRRVRFEKVYDLTERVLPKVATLPAPPEDEHTQWACSSALDRLGIATPRELAAFWNAVSPARAGAWCSAGVERGELVPLRVEGAPQGRGSTSYARADWRRRLDSAPAAPPGMRLLSPFDPLIRDRARALRLFNFDYRFEAFTPAARRKYGYYTLPVLEGERLVGRLDPRLDRERSTLIVRGPWWEPGIRSTRARRAELDTALQRYALFCGAERVETSG